MTESIFGKAFALSPSKMAIFMLYKTNLL